MWKSCVHPELKHPGHPVWAKNFLMTKEGILCVRCPETGRWFEAFCQCVRYKCCAKLVWVEKDFLFHGTQTLDLTINEPPV